MVGSNIYLYIDDILDHKLSMIAQNLNLLSIVEPNPGTNIS